MTRLSIRVAVVVAVGAANVAFAQSRCDSTITRAAGKKVACKASVNAKAQKSGGAPDPAKLATCEAKFAKGCANGRAAGDCVVQTGSCTGIEGTVDACVTTLSGNAAPTTTTTLVPGCGNGVVEPGEQCDPGAPPPQCSGAFLTCEVGGAASACTCCFREFCQPPPGCCNGGRCVFTGGAGGLSSHCVGGTCTTPSNCPGGSDCQGGSCCGLSSYCETVADCCPGYLCIRPFGVPNEFAGRCCAGPGTGCSGPSDCCSGTCDGGSGTCGSGGG